MQVRVFGVQMRFEGKFQHVNMEKQEGGRVHETCTKLKLEGQGFSKHILRRREASC